jgi:hypothetical protein
VEKVRISMAGAEENPRMDFWGNGESFRSSDTIVAEVARSALAKAKEKIGAASHAVLGAVIEAGVGERRDTQIDQPDVQPGILEPGLPDVQPDIGTQPDVVQTEIQARPDVPIAA